MVFFRKNKIKPLVQNASAVFIGVLFTIVLIVSLYHLLKVETTIARDYIILCSSYAAGIGWVIGLYFSTERQRKQHTITVLLSHTKGSVYQEHVRRFVKEYPPDKNTPIDLKKVLSDANLKESIRYILNEYEFIAAAIKRKDLDYCLMKDTMRLQLCTAYRKCKPLIDDMRGVSDTDTVGPKNPRLYEHLIDLYKDWSNEDRRK